MVLYEKKSVGRCEREERSSGATMDDELANNVFKRTRKACVPGMRSRDPALLTISTRGRTTADLLATGSHLSTLPFQPAHTLLFPLSPHLQKKRKERREEGSEGENVRKDAFM